MQVSDGLTGHWIENRTIGEDFPHNPAVKTLCFQFRGNSLVKELGTHRPCGKAKKIKSISNKDLLM